MLLTTISALLIVVFLSERMNEKRTDEKTNSTSDIAVETMEKKTLPEREDKDSMLLFVSDSQKRISGFFTGKYSEQNGYIELNYKDSIMMIENARTFPILSAEIVPVGNISQQGKSACGAACLYMLMQNQAETVFTFRTYDLLLKYAENNGFNNQGSLFSENGGMDSEKLQELAESAYGVELDNLYQNNIKPSETLTKLIDKGKQAIVLVQSKNGQILAENGLPHFILVTGYEKTEEELIFIVADSNYYENDNPTLKYINSDLIDKSAMCKFDEPNAILCLKD